MNSTAIAWLLVLALGAIFFWRLSGPPSSKRERRRGGAAAAGAVYDLLNRDKRNALEIVVEDRAAACDPEDLDGNASPPLLALPLAVGIALAAAPALAHHSRAMFDMGRNVTYRGVVEEYRWQNPHSQIVIRVGADAADRSTVGTWTVEASAIGIMTSGGWTQKTYKPGDRIALVAHPNMDGSNLVLLFYAIKADGTRLYRAAHQYDGEKE